MPADAAAPEAGARPMDPRPATFHTTRWSLVTSAQAEDPAEQQLALRELCELYWYPLYAYLRRSGEAESDALDLVQGFLAKLLERPSIGGAHPAGGRFRGYVIGALKHFVANERRRSKGDLAFSLASGEAAERYSQDASGDVAPDAQFDRSWALLLLEQAVDELEREYAARGRQALFAALRDVLGGEQGARSHAQRAADLGMSEGAVRVATHRMRARLRQLVRQAVAHTVESDAEVDEEINALFVALGGPERTSRKSP